MSGRTSAIRLRHTCKQKNKPKKQPCIMPEIVITPQFRSDNAHKFVQSSQASRYHNLANKIRLKDNVQEKQAIQDLKEFQNSGWYTKQLGNLTGVVAKSSTHCPGSARGQTVFYENKGAIKTNTISLGIGSDLVDKGNGCGKSQNGGVLGFTKVKGHRNNRRTCCPNIVSTYTQGSWKRLAAIQSTGVLNTVRSHTSGGDGSGGCNKIAENQYAEGATIKEHVGGVVQPKNSKCPENPTIIFTGTGGGGGGGSGSPCSSTGDCIFIIGGAATGWGVDPFNPSVPKLYTATNCCVTCNGPYIYYGTGLDTWPVNVLAVNDPFGIPHAATDAIDRGVYTAAISQTPGGCT